MKTIIVNLMGAPCAGKSTLAALVFSKLKMKNISCEIVMEFAKDLVWDESKGLNNQLYVFSEQFYRVWRLQNKVSVIVTDSPMILSIYYNKKQQEENRLSEELFDKLVLECHNRYNNMNFFLDRKHEYQNDGRVHDEQESLQMGEDMLKLYDNLGIAYERIYSSDEMADYIVDKVLKELN